MESHPARHIRHAIIIAFALAVAAARFLPYGGEIYATCLYPYISWGLSFAASFVPFSLEEIIVACIAAALILYPILCLLLGRKITRCLRGEAEIILAAVLWFYAGWGLNYFRTGFYERMMIERKAYDKDSYRKFLDTYTSQLNHSYVEDFRLDKAHTQHIIKKGYRKLPAGFGLCCPQDFQHAKSPLLQFVYPMAGVQGFMGPFMDESQVSDQVADELYATVYAHELSHLLGVAEEAEANFWAYLVCTSSSDALIRYSGYLGILKYVMYQTYTSLGQDEYEKWKKTVDKRILSRYEEIYSKIEKDKLGILDGMQNHMFNLLLRTNRVSDGTMNYVQVLSMIMSYESKEQRPGRFIRQSTKQ